MKIEFDQEYLRELYEEGKASGKQYRFQPPIIRQYQKAITRMRDAGKIEDLFLIASLNYKKLGGNKKGQESVRVNDQYRIEFKSRTEGKEPETITICSIIELSKHYE